MTDTNSVAGEKLPVLVNIRELGITDSDLLVTALGTHVARVAQIVVLDNQHYSSRDGRKQSRIRRTGNLIDVSSELPTHLHDALSEVYDMAGQRLGAYLGRPVGSLQTMPPAMGHNYLPGDPASEGHVDVYPSATWYLQVPDAGGELVVAGSPDAKTIEEIEVSQPSVIVPSVGDIAIFDGQRLPHYVRGLPISNRLGRVSINFSFTDGSVEAFDPTAYGEGYFTTG